MKFIFQGPPIAKKRHRSTVVSGRVQTYDMQNAEALFCKNELISQVSKETYEKRTEMANAEAFHVDLHFHLPFPKKFSQAKIKAIMDGIEPNIANVKPDFDNLVKFYLDVANEILYKDDRQIISSSVTKRFHTSPRTELTIIPHKGFYE